MMPVVLLGGLFALLAMSSKSQAAMVVPPSSLPPAPPAPTTPPATFTPYRDSVVQGWLDDWEAMAKDAWADYTDELRKEAAWR